MIRLNDLRVTDLKHRQSLLKAFENVLIHGQVLLGPECEQLESISATLHQKKFGVAVASGSSALYLALKALDIGPGDEVITTSLSWIATNNAISLTGATPINVDVDSYQNIDLYKARIAITKRTKAIIPVHFTGIVVRQSELKKFSLETGIPVIEDAAQAFRGRDIDGSLVGSSGVLTCFSMNAMKPFRSYGEAGLIVTDDESLKHRLEILRYNGMSNREVCISPSINGRIDTLQAAALLINIEKIDQIYAHRKSIAEIYRSYIDKRIMLQPKEQGKEVRSYHTFPILVPNRDKVQEKMLSAGVETGVHHKLLMQMQPAYKSIPNPPTPIAEAMVQQLMSIPMHDNLTDKDAIKVSRVINYVCGFS